MENNKSAIVGIVIILIVAVGAIMVAGKKSPAPREQSGSTTEITTSATSSSPETSPAPLAEGNQKLSMLSVTSPADKSTVTSPTVTVRGKTAPNADVFVNDAEAKADANGSFAVSVTLDEGENPIVISVNDADGNYAEQELSVTYDAGQ
jgi:hypothetical protein